jgi:hypothetical protein
MRVVLGAEIGIAHDRIGEDVHARSIRGFRRGDLLVRLVTAGDEQRAGGKALIWR